MTPKLPQFHHAKLATVCVANFIFPFQSSRVTFALPGVQEDPESKMEILKWVVLAYSLTFVLFPRDKWHIASVFKTLRSYKMHYCASNSCTDPGPLLSPLEDSTIYLLPNSLGSIITLSVAANSDLSTPKPGFPMAISFLIFAVGRLRFHVKNPMMNRTTATKTVATAIPALAPAERDGADDFGGSGVESGGLEEEEDVAVLN